MDGIQQAINNLNTISGTAVPVATAQAVNGLQSVRSGAVSKGYQAKHNCSRN